MNDASYTVLGVDLASKRWIDIGTALVSVSAATSRCEVAPHAIRWPVGEGLDEVRLADAIDGFATANGVAVVSIDGPQGWRHPAAPASQGVGRACEQSAHTPGKTGPLGQTYPRNQVGWISFSITVFELLIRRGHVHLVDDTRITVLEPPSPGEYYVMECFPTVTWRSAGLAPLPGKGKRPDTRDFAGRLASRWPLSPFDLPIGHDDLQAIVAALPAAALLGCGQAIAHGASSAIASAQGTLPAHRVEGIIWDASPPLGAVPGVSAARIHGVSSSSRSFDERVERGAAALIPFVQKWGLPLNPEHLDELAAAVLVHCDSSESWEQIEAAVNEQLADFHRRREAIEESYRRQLRESGSTDP